MILNPAGPASFFLPVGVEVGQDGPAAAGVYVGQPGLLWRLVGVRLPRVRQWHWTRVIARRPTQYRVKDAGYPDYTPQEGGYALDPCPRIGPSVYSIESDSSDRTTDDRPSTVGYLPTRRAAEWVRDHLSQRSDRPQPPTDFSDHERERACWVMGY